MRQPDYECVGVIHYDEWQREHGERLRHISDWYKKKYLRRRPKRTRPRHPAEERLLGEYEAWRRSRGL